MNYKITKDEIFQATDGGLEVIRFYITDIDSFIGSTNKKFTIRDEKTPSCSIKKLSDGNYVVTDFGDDGTPMNAIGLVQKMENCSFGDAIKIIVERHNLSGEGNGEVISIHKSIQTSAPAGPDQVHGDRFFNHSEEVSEAHLRIIFSKNVWSYLLFEYRNLKTPEERDKAVLTHLRSILKEQHWHSLDSYVCIFDRKAVTYASTETYPIFLIEECTKEGKRFSKIYQPRHKDKGKRFFYHGDFDKNYLHGWDQVKRAYEQLLADSEDEEDSSTLKLDHVFYCTGGSDALNLRAVGYHVVYPSSEHFKLSKDQLFKLFQRSHSVLTCPDLDYTGQFQNHKLCVNDASPLYLDVRTVELPHELKKHKDQYGRPCKDTRDFLNYFKVSELRNLVSVSKMYRFWEAFPRFDRSGKPKMRYGSQLNEYKLSTERILNFLVKAGFGRRKVNDELVEFIQIDGKLVRQVKAEDIKAYLVNFLRKRFMHEDLLNAVHSSTSLSASSFDALPMLDPDFRDYDNLSQYLFFQNITWKITGEGIEEIKNENVQKMVWESRILPYKVKKQKPLFTVRQGAGNACHIDIHNQESLFFKFLIQTSRVHWRTELEDNLDNLSKNEADAYKSANKFNIHGPNLKDFERQEQEQHLINKMYAFGYLMHRYKFKSRAWVVFGMDDTPQKDNGSYGGTGKSIFFEGVSIIKNRLFLDGKNDDLFKDNHVFENVSTNTDVIYIDDTSESFPMKRIFSMTTGDITVNPKGKARTPIKYDKAPKMGITSNFSPDDLGPSVMRRILFFGTSNYYHVDKSGMFNENRQPIDDFGKEFWSPEYTPAEWEADFNFMAQCCQLYLSWPNWIEAPMGNIMNRSLSINMGFNFLAWAEVFFSEESNKLDCFVSFDFAKEDYKSVSGIKSITSQGFNGKLKMYADLKGLTLNPKAVQGKAGRVTKRLPDIKFDNRDRTWVKLNTSTVRSMIYLQSRKDIISERVYDPTEIHTELPVPVEGTEAPSFQ